MLKGHWLQKYARSYCVLHIVSWWSSVQSVLKLPQTVFEFQSGKENFNADGDGDGDADAMVNDEHEIYPACKRLIVLLASWVFLFAPLQIYYLFLQVQVGFAL